MPSFVETFDSLAGWDIDPGGLPAEVVVSAAHATDGPTSARVHIDSVYVPSPAGFALQRLDVEDGDDPATVYWLRYAFLLEDWAPVWWSGDGQPFYLPNLTNFDDFGSSGLGPTIVPLSQTTGEFSGFGTATQPLTAGVWHTYRIRLQCDGVNVSYEEWFDGVSNDSDVFASALTPPKGVWIGNDLSNVRGTFWVDDLVWSPNADPGDADSTESAAGTSTSQWVKIREHPAAGGTAAAVAIELASPVSEAWTYAEVYVPQALLDELGTNDATNYFISANGNDFLLLIRRAGASDNWVWEAQGSVELGAVTGDKWFRIELHSEEGADEYQVRIDGTTYAGIEPGGS